MNNTIFKPLAFAVTVFCFTATLALAQATDSSDRPAANPVYRGTVNDPATQRNTGRTVTQDTPRVYRDGQQGPEDAADNNRLGGNIASECVPGTGIGAVPCMPVERNKNLTPPGTGWQGGFVK